MMLPWNFCESFLIGAYKLIMAVKKLVIIIMIIIIIIIMIMIVIMRIIVTVAVSTEEGVLWAAAGRIAVTTAMTRTTESRITETGTTEESIPPKLDLIYQPKQKTWQSLPHVNQRRESRAISVCFGSRR